MWPETFKLYGHSAVHNFKKVADGYYRCTDSYYTRIIGDEPNIEAIDFDGGPYLSLGAKIETSATVIGTIDSISSSGIIHFINDSENDN